MIQQTSIQISRSRERRSKPHRWRAASGTAWWPPAARRCRRTAPPAPSPATPPTAHTPTQGVRKPDPEPPDREPAPQTKKPGQIGTYTNLLLERGGVGEQRGRRRGGRGGGGEAVAALLQEALLAPALADLHHVVLAPPPPLLGVHRHLVAVPPHLHPLARAQRHGWLAGWVLSPPPLLAAAAAAEGEAKTLARRRGGGGEERGGETLVAAGKGGELKLTHHDPNILCDLFSFSFFLICRVCHNDLFRGPRLRRVEFREGNACWAHR